jgi:hypothetical protein
VATPAGFTLESSGSGDDVFTIMPATFEPGKKGPFHLSVVCDAEFRLTRDRGGGQRASVVGSAAAAAGATSGTAVSSGADSAAGSSSSKHHKGGSSRHSAKQPSSTAAAAAVAPAPVATATTAAPAATAVAPAASASVSATATSALIDGVAPLPSLHKQPSASAATLGVVTSPFANTAVAAAVSTRRGSPGGMR